MVEIPGGPEGGGARLARAFALLVACVAGAQAAEIAGRVHDAVTGAPIGGAQVRLLGEDASAEATTSAGGDFLLEGPARGAGRLSIRAHGYIAAEVPWPGPGTPLEIALVRANLHEEITVTAGRSETRLGDEAARVLVLDRTALGSAAPVVLDDVLRSVPGFSLFRRSSSQVANPTSQGVSLRGVGPSGASRALVLLDGVPQNDPFGGWIYWSRISLTGIERVEVVEGGASALYGSAAMGGVIQALSRPAAPALTGQIFGGSRATAGAAFDAAARREAWSTRLAGHAFTSDGYTLVADDERGAVDSPATGQHLAGSLSLGRRLGGRANAFARVSGLGESRRNGTPLQNNDTSLWQASGGADWQGDQASLVLRAWGGQQTYHQSFSAVAPDRASESLTRLQRVPANASGLTLTWSRGGRGRHALGAGLDAGFVRGRSDETAFAAQRATALASSGGRQRSLGLYATDRIALGRSLLLTVGLRGDRAWLDEASATTTSLIGAPAPRPEQFAARDETAFSPRLALVARVTPEFDLTASAYGAYRTPTLNELYRSFRVGDTLTRANPELERERLYGAEAGLRFGPRKGHWRARLVGFMARVDDPVANVTLLTTPQLVTRQRQNLGRTRSLGLAFDTEVHLGRSFNASAGYAFVDAVVARFPTDPSLEGRRVPQVPRHQVTLQARFLDPRRIELAAELRLSSKQYEDDRNTLSLAGFAALDARIARRLRPGLQLFAAVENLTGQRSEVGRTPVLTLGAPRLARIGLRFELDPPATDR